MQDMNNSRNSTNDEFSDEEAPAKKKQNMGNKNKAQHDFEDRPVPVLIQRKKIWKS